MKRLTKDTIDKIRCRAKAGASLNQIENDMKLSRSTVYYWFRKFSNKKIIPVSLNETAEQVDLGEFLGIFAGDGNYYFDRDYRHVIRIFLDSKYGAYVVHVSDLFVTLFNKRPWIYAYNPSNVTIVRAISKPIVNFIVRYLEWHGHKSANVRLKDRNGHGNNFFVGFLRGLIDTDGYINGKRAIFSTISEGLAQDIVYGLNRLGIEYKLYRQQDKRPNMKPVYRISIAQDFDKFVSVVSPNRFKDR